MFCSKCGTKVAGEGYFCSKCGYDLSLQKEEDAFGVGEGGQIIFNNEKQEVESSSVIVKKNNDVSDEAHTEEIEIVDAHINEDPKLKTPPPKEIQNKEVISNPQIATNNLVGIKGWLLLFVISQFFTLINQFTALMANINYYTSGELDWIIDKSSKDYSQEFHTLLNIETWGGGIIALLVAINLILIFNYSKHTKTAIFIFMGLSCLFPFILIERAGALPIAYSREITPGYEEIMSSFIAYTVIWGICFIFSKRVKNTFVK